MLLQRTDSQIKPVAVLIGMCDGDPMVEVFSDIDRALEYGDALSRSCDVSLRIELRYVDYQQYEMGEA